MRSRFITGQGVELQNLLQEATPANGGYNVVVPSENLLIPSSPSCRLRCLSC